MPEETRFIYFLAPIGGGPIKIGCSREPKARIEQLLLWSPAKLEILAMAPGNFTDERRMHSAFSASWLHGEWFAATPEIYALIAQIRATSVIPAEYRGTPGMKRNMPNRPPRKWTEEQRVRASESGKRRWAAKMTMRRIRPLVEAFLLKTGMPDGDLCKAVGMIGIIGQIRRENLYFAEEAERVLAYIEKAQAA